MEVFSKISAIKNVGRNHRVFAITVNDNAITLGEVQIFCHCQSGSGSFTLHHRTSGNAQLSVTLKYLYLVKAGNLNLRGYTELNLVLCGDLLYHGPRNDLPNDYNPKAVIKILNSISDKILAVRGNCDAEVDEMISNFTLEPSITLVINGKTVKFTHGHKENIDKLPYGVDVLVYGHFHTGYIKRAANVLCINSGSITLPKNGTPASFLLIDGGVVSLLKEDEMLIDSVEI